MKKQSHPFMIRTFPTVFPDINTGGYVEIDGTHRVTSIKSVKYVNGLVEVKGLCKKVERKGNDERVHQLSEK